MSVEVERNASEPGHAAESEIELLCPAKNLQCGMEAIKHGADAVYIGAPRFGARVAATNSWEDLERLVRFAHLYRAKVHITLNTILNDDELEEARRMAWRCHALGADALIIQDMGLLRVDLPPIALHASTQMDNRTPEKVRFLQEVGFQRVILARELSLAQIADIRRQTTVPLEAFVHGSLCVSYSGQCYMSYAGCGRSANRGECAQYCRLPYTLTDADGKLLHKEAHLLSLKDMDRSASLADMIAAGVTSFKVEGRLKEVDYVKNITGYYRRMLDAVLEGREELRPSSAGKVTVLFNPQPSKTFHRGATEYFLRGRTGDEHRWETPKSLGEQLGRVSRVDRRSFQLETMKEVHNGDGLCFLNAKRQLVGFRLNRVEGATLFPLEMPEELQPGMLLYRNEDRMFSKQMEGETAVRKMEVSALFRETEMGYSLTLSDEDGETVSREIVVEKQLADHPERAEESLRQQLSKTGNTPFSVTSIEVRFVQPRFIPMSVVNKLRRETLEALGRQRENRKPQPVQRQERPVSWKMESALSLDYTANVLNSAAVAFYKEHGVRQVAAALEAQSFGKKTASPESGSILLMRCKYCLRYAMGACKRQMPSTPAAFPGAADAANAPNTPDAANAPNTPDAANAPNTPDAADAPNTLNTTNTPVIPETSSFWKEPLYLRTADNRYELRFDCLRCEMLVYGPVNGKKNR